MAIDRDMVLAVGIEKKFTNWEVELVHVESNRFETTKYVGDMALQMNKVHSWTSYVQCGLKGTFLVIFVPIVFV